MAIPKIRLMSTLGVLAPLRERILPEYERSRGISLDVIFNPTNVLADRVDAGERADVIIAISDMVRGLANNGILSMGSIRDLASTTVGLAKIAGSPDVTINSEQEFISCMLTARSVVFSQTGASGVFFRTLIERLGIAEQVLAKAKIIPQGLTAEHILTGEVEFAVQQMSELLAVSGVDVIGPFPAELNHTTIFTASAFAEQQDSEVVADFLEFITSNFARKSYLAGGLDVPGGVVGAGAV
ncbi:substrate-binding domain-containing protein [Agrobacterium sp. S2/73]|uniref:molybdate ABC transporter substrate-binding protein n=1 Tax=Agrobacterium TaxID=357 RepID=UPI001574CAB2|nr:substrate-binding domain-containing protein [Agrobacterium sp. S7/73]MBO9112077.1 substrate-binding domain-containing protein [Agrobacterium sp. S2/73]NTA13402.1 ABC transporter substrate-binding protein [Agrobacterium tumefaciens]QXZ76425.1 substrate-binding domain-containing protein [Agrobacterium sp. S7/73]